MNLQALVLCSDEKITRVLRRVLNDLDIAMEPCPSAEVAIQKLSRRRFEAIIVDCDDPALAGQILKAARSSPSNKKAVAVAIINGQTDVRNAFELGAHFVLYKPISAERAKGSFRAARALMKCERRRASRIPVEMPVMYRFKSTQSELLERTLSSDLSEDGIGVRLARRHHNRGPMSLQFKLPGSKELIEAEAELAWENPNGQAGIRFLELPVHTRESLREWLRRNSPDQDDDPPTSCKLTDLSVGGCYLETSSPFPARAKVELSMRVQELEVHAFGVVQVMHPDVGMGVIFVQKTAEQRNQVEAFIQALMSSNGVVPEILVQPDGLDSGGQDGGHPSLDPDIEDPLLELFYTKGHLATSDFLNELRKQRRSDVVQPEPSLPA
jgi:DNA-binding response OmpR family regulator